MTIKILQNLPETIHVTGRHKTRIVFVNGSILPLQDSLKVSNHSPDGFSWGYEGSGPAQLALAILLLFLPAHYATSHYQQFKRSFVAKWKLNTDFSETIAFREYMISLVLNTKTPEKWKQGTSGRLHKTWNKHSTK
jgi:hypothetical protein